MAVPRAPGASSPRPAAPIALTAPVRGRPERAAPAAAAAWTADFARRRTLGVIAALVILAMILLAVLADALPLPNPEETSFLDVLKPPSAAHPLGTDAFGRDALSRMVYGSRTALLVGFVSSIVGSSLGALLGVISAYFGGKVDLALERLMDMLLSFPLIILAIAVVAALGNGVDKLILAVTVPMIPRVSRVVRASALAVRAMPYVEAARCIGAGHARIILRHMLPNVLAPYLIMLTAFLGQAILLEASLSFLGLGVAEPTATWGLMLKGAVATAERAPWLALAPGLAISAAVLAFNLLGDSLRDALDPRLRMP